MSKVIGLTCHETPVRGLLQLSAVLLTSAAAVRSHQAESFLECSAYGFMIHQAEDEAAPQRGFRGSIHPSLWLTAATVWLSD